MIEIAGWAGGALIILAYVMLVSGRAAQTEGAYHLFNVVGSAGLLVNAVAHGAFPAAALNLLFGLVAIWGIRRSIT